MTIQDELTAVTPIDGRYASRINELRGIVSEYGLIKYRVIIEVRWLQKLGSGLLPDIPPLDNNALKFLDTLIATFNEERALEIKRIEQELNHDVKSVEVWLTRQLPDDLFKNYKSLVHFGCTSEDINNLSYALMISSTITEAVAPKLDEIVTQLSAISGSTATIPMLARTHGQPASPVTLGKELRVFIERLERSIQALKDIKILGKFNGATGGYSAASIAYPEVDWPTVSKAFIQEDLGLVCNPVTTQIEPHDWIARICNEVTLSNTILTDLATDIWQYISVEYFIQEVVKGEVGSSTMPHKVNPINFENAEGNFGIANSIFIHLATKLPQSRLQRDLSDSTAQRALGEAFAHTLIAHKALLKGLTGIKPNPDKMAEDLEENWAVLTEAVQSVMRRYGATNAYDAMKAASRGKHMTKDDYVALVDQIDLPKDAKERLTSLSPSTYIGYSAQLAKKA